VDLALEIARPGSGLIWSPTQQCFLNSTHKKHNIAELTSHNGDTSHAKSAASYFPSELYLNKEELASLALIVGVQGMRTIESQLLSLLAEQVGAHHHHLHPPPSRDINRSSYRNVFRRSSLSSTSARTSCLSSSSSETTVSTSTRPPVF